MFAWVTRQFVRIFMAWFMWHHWCWQIKLLIPAKFWRWVVREDQKSWVCYQVPGGSIILRKEQVASFNKVQWMNSMGEDQ